jgi:threonine dehydrogenase-like Zn-dependent dehydrogenase
MKAVRCKDHKACLTHVSAPTGEGVRVKVAAAGICGTDLHFVQAGYDIPFTLGHEIAGITENGTPVAIEPTVYCGHCSQCLTGAYNRCERGTAAVLGVGQDGGMAEELIVPERCLVRLPANVSVHDACLVEPLSVAVRGIALAGIASHHRVAVIGGGTIGQCAVAIAKMATPHVHLYARHDSQRRAGELLGARLEGAGDCDLVIDCAGTDAAVAQAVSLCKPGATLLLLASYWGGLNLPATEVMMKEIRIVSSMAQARQGLSRDVDIAAAAMAMNPAIATAIITHRLPLDAAEEAFSIAGNRAAGAIKVTINP